MKMHLNGSGTALWLAIGSFVISGASHVLLAQRPASPDVQPLPSAPGYSSMTGADRWDDYVHQNFVQPGAFFEAFFSTLGDQSGNVPSSWGNRPGEFPQRFASEFARFTIGGTIKSALAAGLGEDTRFHTCRCQEGWQRAAHALSRTLITVNQNGQKTIDVAGLVGIYGGPMLMTTWYPARYSAFGYGIRQGTLAVGVTTAINLFREFSPELKRSFRIRKFAERADLSQRRPTLP